MLLQGLQTPRLTFRRFTAADADDLLVFFQDEEATRLFPIYQNDPLAHAKARIAAQQIRYEKNGDGLCAIVDRQDGTLIGQCGLLWQEVTGVRELEIGYHLQPQHWKKGYATEAARGVRDFAFKKQLAESLISIIDVRNLASQKVAERNGMKRDQKLNWKEREVFIYRITRREWLKERKK